MSNEKQFVNPFSLVGKRILVTGASSGLGKHTALVCAKMGAEVVITGRDERRLSDVHKELQNISPADHKSVIANLTDAEQRARIVAAVGSALNGVLHGAGISKLRPVRMIDERHLGELQDININAPILLTQALLKKNLIAKEGSILFIASIAANIGVPGVGGYAGTKAALVAMARCLALEVAKHRIRVNCLLPGLVETPMLEAASTVIGSMDSELGKYPLGFGKPSDVANAAVYFLSGASRWVTGSSLVIDGGTTID
ncbi:SDR family oxidoreductase [Candidimonas sp. SYP-B2681]|uniref:SDR family NAD(P)-dependent oxidoreductase n=1 Tax=Candidimonas sp. SYP-B2681 TaxID=2497686 RepID=UPI000F8687FD|nr:SDR family oxidoreductase [Candidimonas sp. SYP-B2681]RTZ47580.1 SDR family oxidoreductase [Candidimonas sp. SYP-B2681]